MCVLCIHSTYDHTWVQERSICCNSFLFNTSWCLSYVPTSQRPYTSHQVFTPHTFDFPGSCQSYTYCVRPVTFLPYARFPCMLLSFVTVQFTPPMSQIIPKEFQRRRRKNPGKPTRGQGPMRRPRKEGEKEPNVAANIAFLNCCIVFPSCC